MQSPAALLQSALYESNETKRLQKVARACKIIADVLPFKEQNVLLLEEDDIIKYLLLSSGMVPSSIDLILTVMIQKFRLKDIFLRSFWQACDYIACISEQTRRRSSVFPKLAQSLKSIQNPMSNQSPIDRSDDTTVESIELTLLLSRNVPTIKLTSLNYLEILMDFFVKDSRFPSYHYHLTQTPMLIRKYLENSNEEKVIVKACKIMGMAKTFSFDKLSFEYEVEAILMAKKSQQQQHHHNYHTGLAEDNKDASLNNNDDANKETTSGQKLRKSKSKLTDHQDKIHDEEDDENDEMDSEFRDQVVAEIEEFLAQGIHLQSPLVDLIILAIWPDGIPLIPKDQFMNQAVRSPINIELLLALALDPQTYNLDESWERFCPKEANDNALEKFLVLSSKRREKFEFHLKNTGIHFRSYKVMQALTESRNYRYIMTMNYELQDFFFNLAHESLVRNTFYCNMNHVVRIIEFFLHRDEDMALSYILSFNFPFIIMNFLDFQFVQQSFLNLFNCSETSFLSKSNQEKVYQYAFRSKLFVDLAKMVLFAEDSIDPKKTSQNYQAMGVPITIEVGNNREKLDYSTQSDSIFDFAHNVFPELKKNFQPDIDRIKGQYFSSLEPNRIVRISTSKRSSAKIEESKLQEIQKERESSTKAKFMGHEYDKIPKSAMDRILKYPSLKARWESFLQDMDPEQVADLKDPTIKLQKKLTNINMFKIKDPKTPLRNEASNNTFGNSPMMRSTSRPKSLSRGMSGVLGEGNQSPVSPIKQSDQGVEPKYQSNTLKLKITSMIASALEANSPEKNSSMKNAAKFEGTISFNQVRGPGSLYPLETKDIMKTKIDKEAESSNFQISKIRENDGFPLIITELLHMVIRRMIENDQNSKMKTLLRKQACSYSQLWQAILGVEDSIFFEYLLKNYLFKIKVHHTKNLNSGYEAGESVNLLLEYAESNQHISKYFDDIHRISQNFFIFITKQIIQSHSWTKNRDVIVSLQTLTLPDTLGTARLQLVRTFYLILKNDKSQKYSLLDQVSDTCWHTLITWIFNYRTNNMYLNLIYSLLELPLEHGSERIVITILIKLDLIIRMRNTMSEVYQNGMFLKELHIANLLFFFRRVVKLVEKIQEKDYPNLKSQLANSYSWTDLKQQLYPSSPVIISDSKTNIKSSRDSSLLGNLEDKSRLESARKSHIATPSRLSFRFLTPQRETSTRPSVLLPPIQMTALTLTNKNTDLPLNLGGLSKEEKRRSSSTKNLIIIPNRKNLALEPVIQKAKTESPSLEGKIHTPTPNFKTINSSLSSVFKPMRNERKLLSS